MEGELSRHRKFPPSGMFRIEVFFGATSDRPNKCDVTDGSRVRGVGTPQALPRSTRRMPKDVFRRYDQMRWRRFEARLHDRSVSSIALILSERRITEVVKRKAVLTTVCQLLVFRFIIHHSLLVDSSIIIQRSQLAALFFMCPKFSSTGSLTVLCA